MVLGRDAGLAPSRGIRVLVGADLASASAVADSIGRFGERYLRRVFTDAELESATGPPAVMAARLAGRFAVKEAVVKVLRPVDEGLDWRWIETSEEESGACNVRLFGSARRLADEAHLCELSVTLSHEHDLAAAVVVGVVCEAA